MYYHTGAFNVAKMRVEEDKQKLLKLIVLVFHQETAKAQDETYENGAKPPPRDKNVPKAIIATAKAIQALYQGVMKRRKISHVGRYTYKELESETQRAKSLEIENKQDKSDSLSLNQWTKETASRSIYSLIRDE